MKDGKPWLPDDVETPLEPRFKPYFQDSGAKVPTIEEAKKRLAALMRRETYDRVVKKHAARPAYDETDPNGLSPHTPGAKLDQGKNRLGLVLMDFASALIEVGKVGTYGAGKYTDHGWVTVPEAEHRYTDAMFRHLLAEGTGEMKDKDTDLLHAAHAAWNALARLRFILERQHTVAPNAEATCPRQ